MTLMPVHRLSFLAPLLVGPNHCIWENTLQDLLFWRCSDPVWPSLFGPCQSHSDLFTCPFFLLPTHEIQEMTVHLLPNISHPSTGAIVMILYNQCYSLHLSVVLNVVADQCTVTCLSYHSKLMHVAYFKLC